MSQKGEAAVRFGTGGLDDNDTLSSILHLFHDFWMKGYCTMYVPGRYGATED